MITNPSTSLPRVGLVMIICTSIPSARFPALTHGDFTLFETIAINRYVDEAFDGPPLQPASPRDRARMMQLVSMADSYGYRPLVWGIYVESTLRPTEGKIPDQQLITAAIPKARRYLETLDGLSSQQRYLTCDHPTLADFHTAPIFGYFLESEIGRQMIGAFPRLQQWWGNISSLPAWKTALKP